MYVDQSLEKLFEGIPDDESAFPSHSGGTKPTTKDLKREMYRRTRSRIPKPLTSGNHVDNAGHPEQAAAPAKGSGPKSRRRKSRPSLRRPPAAKPAGGWRGR